MLPLYTAYRRVVLSFRMVALATISGLAIIAVLPKPRGYASPTRLGLTIAFFCILAGGLAACIVLARRAADSKLAFKYHGASRNVATTISYLTNERQGARRGVLPALVSSIALFGLYMVSAWPQFAALNPYRDTFGTCAAVALALAALTPFWQRKKIINALYLQNTLRLQIRQIGFRPRTGHDARRLAADLARPAISAVTPTGFNAGGFDWKFSDFQQNVLVLGAIGSGKTTTILNSLLEGLLASSALSPTPIAGILIDPKGDYKKRARLLASKYGRESDLVILSADDWERDGGTVNAVRYNRLDSPDDSLEIASQIMNASKLVGGLKVGDNSFFYDAARSFFRHALDLLRSANDREPPSMLDIQRLATEQPPVKGDYGPFYLDRVSEVLARYPDYATMPAATKDALDYFENEYKNMADRQKSGVIGSVTQILDEFSVEPFRSMMSGRTTISIADIIDTGKILIVDLPAASRPRMAALVTGLIKLAFQREILRRVDKQRPSFLFADEFHLNWSAGEQGDADFFSLSRQSNHFNIVAAQNASSFYKKVTNKDEVRNFFGVCAVKIFLRNTEAETNKWASELFGERTEIVVSSNEHANLDHPLTRGKTSYTRSTVTVRTVPPETFTKLAIPVRDNPSSHYAETIIHVASREATQKLDLSWRVNVP